MTFHDKVCVREEDAIRLILEFLSRRELSISQLSLERESGIYNCSFSDDLIFLRQLILDGQWEDVLQFVSPLDSMEAFDQQEFRFIVYKHKYVELLCIRAEAGSPYQTVEVAVEDIIQCLNHLEKFCSNRDTYNRLSSLLTIPKLNDDEELRNWNPNSWRLKCFNDIRPLVEKFMQSNSSPTGKLARDDRLMKLIFKGLMYERCLNLIQKRLEPADQLLKGPDVFNEIDHHFNLTSFLQSLPDTLFQYFVDSKTELGARLAIEKHDKPELVASWSEMILSTPIKPNVFPHTAVPYTRIKAADLMSKSLSASLMQNAKAKDLMIMSVCDIAQFSRSTLEATGFHISSEEKENDQPDCDRADAMQSSFSRLFHGKDAFCSSRGCEELEKSEEGFVPRMPTIKERTLEEECVMNQPPGSGTSATDAMSESYLEIWMSNQKAKGKLLAGINRSKPSLGLAQRNREESSRLSRSSRGTLAAANHSRDLPTPRRPLTSTPNSVVARSSLLEEPPHLLWNSPQDRSLLTDTRHGLRASPISPTPSFQSHTQNSHQFDLSSELSSNDVQFVPIAKVQDQQAIRAAEFHPNGKFYAIGSNSKLLRVCQYSSHDTNNNNAADRSATDIPAPEEIYRRPRFHKGSIYCLTWNKLGNLLATGSNDKTIKMLTFNQETEKFRENEVELAMHDGTVRDLCFMDDLTNGSSLLLSGGAGDCKIYITDCETATTFLSLSGHSGTILSLYTWGGAMFVSGSQDRTIRFWDMRSNSCINFVTCPTISRTKPGGAVAAVSVDPSGKLLVSGHEDSTCMLYDIRGGRVIQTFHPHSADIRSIRFSNKAYYLLTGGYDNNIVLTDLQGDLTQPLRSVVVASHQDKVIQCRWHPTEFTFLSTSADKSTILWALPD